MRISHRNSQWTKSSTATTALRITAVVAALLAAPAVLHALVPTSLAILQVVLDVCQFCISTLRICGV